MRGFLTMRVRLPVVVVASAVLVTLILLVFRYALVPVGSDVYRIDTLGGTFCKYPCQTFPPQIMPTQGPTPTPFNFSASLATLSKDERLQAQRSHRLQQLAALRPMSMSNFGQQMEVTPLQLHLQFHQVLESADGSLYIVAESCAWVGAGGCSRYHLGILDGDRLMEIWLPHKSGEWQQMEMLATSTPEVVLVRTMAWGEMNMRQYRVSRHDIIQTAVTHEGAATTPIDKRLGSGETCRADPDLASTTYVDAFDATGHARPLVSKADFLYATQHAIELSDPNVVYCTHFQDVDLLVVGFFDTRVTFVVAPGHVWLASPAEPSAITPHHMVLFTSVIDAQGFPSGDTFDYANVTRKSPLQ
jgi:hypothetical protein